MWGCNYMPFASGGWGSFFTGGILSLLVWGLILALFVYIVVRIIKTLSASSNGSSNDRNDSMSILKARYAKGELSQDEFVKMKQILTQ